MIELKNVLLIGVGLIGGSVALAIKKEHQVHITGFDIKQENLQLAKKMNIIDDFVVSIDEPAMQADLIILACPVEKAERMLDHIATLPLKDNVIITDVCSTKTRLIEKAKALFSGNHLFIGGHPMAGSHKVGPGSAKAHLFENAFYVLTPLELNEQKGIDQLKEWFKGMNANFIIMDAEQHDYVTGVVSHFPHIIAASLVNQVHIHSEQNPHVTALAAGGFRDITRIASSSPEMWRDIVIHNKEQLLSLLDYWEEEMDRVRKLVNESDSDAVYDYFSEAKNFRDSMPIRATGAIRSFYDLYVDVLDKPGVISDITVKLAQANISITNIRIIEAREDVYGVLRISFQTYEDLENAKELLEENGYDTYISI